MDRKKRIEELNKKIASLPKGYISTKTINGKERHYLQWRQDGKVKSRYIKDSEFAAVKCAVAERRAAEAELKALRSAAFAYVYDAGKGGGQPALVAEAMPAYSAPPYMYLKWKDDVIAYINCDLEVRFTDPDYNSVISTLTRGADRWTKEEFISFLSDRIISRDRRDIEKLLKRMRLREYSVAEVAKVSRALNARDLIWLAFEEDEKMEDVVSEVFDSVFFKKRDLQGDSVDTPEGMNVKRYGVKDGHFGIYKKRINPLSTDAEAELAVYEIGRLLGVRCCPCFREDGDTIFSEFVYDFPNEHIVHFRHILDPVRRDDLLLELMAARPQYFADFARMIALDFITRQDDRHLSNIAVCIREGGSDRTGTERFYPLYDNGRSLFFEDTEETVQKAVRDVRSFATSFGNTGTYWDYICELKEMGVDFTRLLNLDVTEQQIERTLIESGFKDYRLTGSLKWIMQSIEMLKSAK